MESRVPIPTDNIYKFYALFALAALISAFAGALYLNKSTNEVVLQIVPELLTLTGITKPSDQQVALKQLREKQLATAKADKDFLLGVISVIVVTSTIFMVVGFSHWHNVIQPKQDRLLDLQIEKAALELAQMKQVKCSQRRS